MKIMLMGNPNVGKSVIFSRLTGARVVASNYPGTTIGFTEGNLALPDGSAARIIDVPGTYSMDPTCKAEDVACRMVGEADVIVNVINATNLERNLNLTLQLIKRRVPMVLVLNLWDEAKHNGITIDAEKLGKRLGVPCIPTCGVTGEGIKRLVEAVKDAAVSPFEFDDDERWHEVGSIVAAVQTITHRHHKLREVVNDATVHPVWGLAIAALVLAGSFALIRVIGESLIGYVFDPLYETLWTPVMMRLSAALGGGGWLHTLLVGSLVDGGIDYVQAMGLLTTGLYVPLAMVFPYVLGFYTVLSVLEDSGYLPRLGVLLDTVMHRVGLHGLSIIPMMLGFGCNVPGALATRILETKRERFIAATLMCITVPCMAQSAVIMGLLGPYGAKGIGTVVLTLVTVWVVLGLLLKRWVKGSIPEIFLEIPAYQVPRPGLIFKKTWMRLVWFFREAVPFVLAGVLLVNLLYLFRVIDVLGTLASPVVTGIAGLPEDAVGAIIVGFFRKDVAVGMLAPLGMTYKQLVIASVMLTMYFPCVATFVVLLKELGGRYTAAAAGVMLTSSLVVGGILNLIL